MEISNEVFVARVAAVGLSASGLAETAEIAAPRGRVTTHAVSITDRAAVQALPN